jgi:hypothetical protein
LKHTVTVYILNVYGKIKIDGSPMTNVISFHEIPSRAEAEGIINKLVADGNFSLTMHCKSRMRERDIAITQVLTCLSKGRIFEGPFLTNERGGGYQVTIERTVAGDNLRVVACMKFSQSILVITAIKYD